MSNAAPATDMRLLIACKRCEPWRMDMPVAAIAGIPICSSWMAALLPSDVFDAMELGHDLDLRKNALSLS